MLKANKYPLEQSVLFITAMLACAYNHAPCEGGHGNDRTTILQKMDLDGLALSGKPWLTALEDSIDELGLLDDFLKIRGVKSQFPDKLQARTNHSRLQNA